MDVSASNNLTLKPVYDIGRTQGVKMLRIAVVSLAFILSLAAVSIAAPRGSSSIGSLPGLDTGLGQQNIIIHDSKGGMTIGTYNRESGDLFLSGPGNKITLGNEDSAGNIWVQEYGEDSDE